ncbi:hypothetical protein JCM1393_15450 [Clostridium carnis]
MKNAYSEREPFLNEVYNKINSSRKKYGQLRKVELHIHTPESNCYRFYIENEEEKKDLEGKYLYSNLTTRQVVDYSYKVGYLSDNTYESILNDWDSFNSDKYRENLKEKNVPFDSFKEYMAYMTIAYKLYKESIEIAVVSDHNTIRGYEKLNYAIKKYFDDNYKNKMKLIKLFLGVEVSCSDRNHLMIIYDEKRIEDLEKYLDYIILQKELGSFYDTRKIIEDMKNHNAITYIAHINTSDLLGNAAYKQKLLNNKWLNGIGLTNIEKLNREKNRVREFRNDISDIAIVYEGDSHEINEIGIKNTWIKMSNLHFKSLKKAFLNHQVCIYTQEQQPVKKYIKGLVVQAGKDGFLGCNPNQRDKKCEELIIDFSKDLNCIIGGRGTGKSTILNILETIYSMECDNWELLNYISMHRKIFSLFVDNDDEYLIEFIPQISLRGSYINVPTILRNSYYEYNNTYKLKPQWYNVFKVIYINGRRRYIRVDDKNIAQLFKKVFRRGYNINKLVEKISTKQISGYIENVIRYNVQYDEINRYIKEVTVASSTRILKVIRDNLDNILKMIEKRRVGFQEVVKEFNDLNSKVLNIEYEPMNDIRLYFDDFIKIFEVEDNSYFKDKHINNTLLTWENVQDYFSELIRLRNYFEVLDLILNKKFTVMNKILPIEKFQTLNESYHTVEKGLVSINNENRKIIYNEIFKRIKENDSLIRSSIINCFKVMDNFNLKFNINSKEDVKNNAIIFKDLRELSLGQKVVALLTFVFNFGRITGDTTPLIIDQPEDNLDNIYIYKTLVNSLKSVKNSRQVIVVTHSSTIVTNADAEEVIVMNSDGNRGWVEKMGYPSDEVITNHIINYLEGGKNSFNHKVKMYGVILENAK